MFRPEGDPDGVDAKLPWDPIDRFIWANLRHAVTFNGGQRFHPKGHMTDYFADEAIARSEEHTSELQSLMCTSYAAFCLKKNSSQTSYYACSSTSKACSTRQLESLSTSVNS